MPDSNARPNPKTPHASLAMIEEPTPRGLLPVPEFDERRLRLQLEDVPGISSQADRRGTKGKLFAGLRGLKQAIRGDSSFYAHLYRG
ncbi:hypothetical protein HK102_012451, partial [Quaeritorhiza haematococci]